MQKIGSFASIHQKLPFVSFKREQGLWDKKLDCDKSAEFKFPGLYPIQSRTVLGLS